MEADALDKLQHLSDIDIPTLVKDIGLYTPILVDTFSKTLFDDRFEHVSISPDVKQLYSLIMLKEPLLLPCANCMKELAFSRLTNPRKFGKQFALIPVDSRQESEHHTSSDPYEYELFNNYLFIKSRDSNDESFKIASQSCMDVLLRNYSFFLSELSCSLNSDHTVRCFFSLSPFEVDKDTEMLYKRYKYSRISTEPHGISLPMPAREPNTKEVEAVRLFEMAEHTLVLKKVGQSPSMADMQYFELRKYKNLLHDKYKELTRAIGLDSAGIGIGAFIYLRRILEAICEESHLQCIDKPNWDETYYRNKHFNEKIDCLSRFGINILPAELDAVKGKLYGVMSKGIHEYTEDECKEMFPHIKTAIELILDQRLADIEKQKKIEAMTKAIGTAKS